MAAGQPFDFAAFLRATGTETGALVAARDWGATALGPLDAWPASLRTALGLVLRSPVPMVLLWGERGVMLYNDAYAAVAGGRHPALLGAEVREGWPEVADFSDHAMRVALGGGTLSYRDQELTLHRHGAPERVWMDLDYSPVPGDDGVPAGVLAVVVETTARVAAEGRGDAAEAALGAERDRAQGVLDNMGEAYAFLSPDLRIVDLNAEALRLDGRPREAVAGRLQWKANPGADPEVLRLLRHAVAAREPVALEHRFEWSDGRASWLDMRAYPAEGGVAVFYRDVTARHEAEEALREREERLRLVVDNATDYAILTLDRDRVVTTWSAGAAAVFGYAADEVVGRSADVLFTPEDRDAGQPEREVEGARRLGVAPDVRWHLRRDGGRVFLNGSMRLLHDGEGREAGFLKIARDETDRHRVEAALRETEERYRLAARATNDAIWDWDFASGHVRWNEALEAAYGHAPAGVEPTGAWWIAHIHPEDRARIDRGIHAVIDGGSGAWTDEYRFRRADGTYADVLDRGHVIRDDGGRALRMIGAMLDLSARKAAEAELRRAKDLLGAVMEAVPGVVYAKDREGRMLAANRGTAELVGKPLSEIVGRTDAEFLDDIAEAEAVMATDRRVMESDAPEVIEEAVSGPDGEALAWLSTKAPFRDADGRVIGLVGSSVDITARKRAEERLRALNDRLEAEVARAAAERDRVWRNSRDLLGVADSDGRWISVNPAWTRVLGWPEAEVLGRTSEWLEHPDDRERTRAEVARLAAGGESLAFENRFREKGDGYRWLSWTAVPEDGLLYASARDVTADKERQAELAEAQEQLRQAQKMEAVGQLTGGLAHDFNNLLTGITGSLDMMATRLARGETDRVGRYLAAATQSANRAAALTHRLLAFSRRQPLDPRPVDVNRLVAGMEDLLRRTIGEGVRLEVVAAGGLWPALCDPHQLESAILNLAINARDAMPDGGRLTVETGNAHLDAAYAARHRDVRPGQYACVSVTDTGTGMSPAVAARAFEPFFTTKPIGQGTGLGLSMIYGFARQSEGHARIYSEEGQGTTVKLYLPRHHGADARARAQAEADAARDGDEDGADEGLEAEAGEVVAVVEDEAVVRDLVVDVLEDLGYRAMAAADGPGGLRLLQRPGRVDLLVTDIGLPGLNGRDLAERARALRPGLRVLFMTGYAENATLAGGFLGPGMQMITKPFAVEALAARVRAMLEGDNRDG